MAADLWVTHLQTYRSGDGRSNRQTAGNVRGMYAVRVKGRVPEDVEAELESRGIKYRPRDQADID